MKTQQPSDRRCAGAAHVRAGSGRRHFRRHRAGGAADGGGTQWGTSAMRVRDQLRTGGEADGIGRKLSKPPGTVGAMDHLSSSAPGLLSVRLGLRFAMDPFRCEVLSAGECITDTLLAREAEAVERPSLLIAPSQEKAVSMRAHFPLRALSIVDVRPHCRKSRGKPWASSLSFDRRGGRHGRHFPNSGLRQAAMKATEKPAIALFERVGLSFFCLVE